MSSLVLDCSVAMTWCFEDEATAFALDDVIASKAVVPAIWLLEVANTLVQSERIKRITFADSIEFLALLEGLPIQLEPPGGFHTLREIMNIARTLGLSSYDASYLELAMRRGIPLATLDHKLKQAATKAGASLYL